MIPDGERVEGVRAEKRNHAPRGNAAAAAPIENVARSWPPVTETQLAEDVVPFPADALAIGEVVAREVGGGLPIRAVGRRAVEKSVAQPVERGPVEFVPGHGAREKPR